MTKLPVDRELLESHLARSEIAAIRLMAKSLGIGPDRWTDAPGLRSFVQTVVAARITRAEMERNGTSQAKALLLASKVGLGPEAPLRNIRAWGGRTPAEILDRKPSGWDCGLNNESYNLNNEVPVD